MAWSTCPYCETRLNGWQNMDRHQRKAHSAEYRIAEAQKWVERAETTLARHTKDKEEYEVLNRALNSWELPGLVIDILTKARDERSVVFYLRGEQVVIPFDEQIAEDTAWLEQKRAELAALQPAAVIA